MFIKQLLFLIVTLAATLSGFADDTIKKAARPVEKASVQLKWFHQFQFAGYYAAVAQGYYRDEGLEVELRERTTAEQIVQQVVEGTADFAIGDSSIVADYANGAPIVALAAVFQHDPLVFISKQSSGIVSPYEMLGKRVMFDRSGGNEAPLRALLIESDISEHEYSYVPDSFNNEDLISGKVDVMPAYLTNQPFYFAERGVKLNIINPQSYGIDVYGDILFTSQRELLEHPGRAARFRRATLKGWKYALDNPEELVQVIHDQYRSKLTLENLRYEANATRSQILPDAIPIGQLEPKRLARIADIYARQNLSKPLGDRELQAFVYGASERLHLSPIEKAWLEEHPVIRVGIDRDFAPYEWVNQQGRYVGLVAEFLSIIQQQLCIRFDIVKDKDWHEVLDMARRSEIDMIAAAVKTPEREQYLTFSTPYVSNQAIIMNNASQGFIGDLGRLNDKKVAVERDYFVEELIAKSFPQIKLISAKNVDDALAMVLNGSADAYVGDAASASFAIKRDGLVNLRYAGHTPYTSQSSIAVAKSEPELASIMEKVLNNIPIADKERIIDRWMGLKIEMGIQPAMMFAYAAGAFFLMAAFSYWIVRLRSEVSARKESESRLAALYTYMSVGFALHEVIRNDKGLIDDYRFLDVNPAFAAMTGLPRDKWIGKRVREVLPGIEDYWIEHYGQVAATGEPKHCENYTRTLGRWFSTYSYQPAPNQFAVIMQDVTDRVRVTQELARSRNLLRTIIETLPLRIFWKDRDSRYLGCNTAFARDAGKSCPDELIGKDDSQLGWREQSGRYRGDDRDVMETDHPKLAYEEPQTTPQGRQIWLRTSKVPLRDENDAIIGVLGIYDDVTDSKQALAALQRATDDLRYAQRIAKLGNWTLDMRTQRYEASEEAFTIIGLEPGSQLSLVDFDALLHPEDLQRFVDYRKRVPALPDGKGDIEYRIIVDGKPKWVRSIFFVMTNRDGAEVRIFGTLQDITDRKNAEESLQLAQLVYQNATEAMMVTDAENRILSINPAFTEITGYVESEVLGQTSDLLNDGRHHPSFKETMKEGLSTTGRWQGEVWSRRKSGEEIIEWLTINTIFDSTGAVYRRVALFSDITDRKAAEALIWKQANLDALTQLPNRRLFADRLQQEIKKTSRDEGLLGLLFVDLDHFKEVNDSLGHLMGDHLLIEAARRIQKAVRESDTVARLGGDEFTVIVPDVREVRDIERIAQELISTLGQPFQLGDEQVYVSASIGITFFPLDAVTPESLFKNADQALYSAKRDGRNRYHYFTPAMQNEAQRRMRLIRAMHQAVDGDEFHLHFQPIVDLVTGRIQKAEALLRWQHPQFGEIAPATFIPIAEDSGLIQALGDSVFHKAIRQVKEWRMRFDPEFQISINKSPMQFSPAVDNHHNWVEAMNQLDLNGQCLVVEITEGCLLKADARIKASLLAFRDAGVQVAIDDFGTGYSSLAYLNRFDIDYLKLDRTFVKQLKPGSSELVLSEAIVIMAHKLGLKVIAEGVETELQKALLREMGCDYAQGFLFSKPVSASDLEQLLTQQLNGF